MDSRNTAAAHRPPVLNCEFRLTHVHTCTLAVKIVVVSLSDAVFFVKIRSPTLNIDAVVTLPKLSTTLMGEPPDASNWSVADVAKYFTDVGFVDQAESFRAEASVSCLVSV